MIYLGIWSFFSNQKWALITSRTRSSPIHMKLFCIRLNILCFSSFIPNWYKRVIFLSPLLFLACLELVVVPEPVRAASEEAERLTPKEDMKNTLEWVHGGRQWRRVSAFHWGRCWISLRIHLVHNLFQMALSSTKTKHVDNTIRQRCSSEKWVTDLVSVNNNVELFQLKKHLLHIMFLSVDNFKKLGKMKIKKNCLNSVI